jgi:hypothetical protein
MVNGESRAHYLRNSMAELQRASTALSQAAGFAVPVFSALVFVDPASLTVKAPPGWDGTDLHVVSERGLLPLLTRRRELSDEQLTTVMDAALRAETWHRSPQPSRPGTHLTQEFQALRDAGTGITERLGDVLRQVARRPPSLRKRPRPNRQTAQQLDVRACGARPEPARYGRGAAALC